MHAFDFRAIPSTHYHSMMSDYRIEEQKEQKIDQEFKAAVIMNQKTRLSE